MVCDRARALAAAPRSRVGLLFVSAGDWARNSQRLCARRLAARGVGESIGRGAGRRLFVGDGARRSFGRRMVVRSQLSCQTHGVRRGARP